LCTDGRPSGKGYTYNERSPSPFEKEGSTGTPKGKGVFFVASHATQDLREKLKRKRGRLRVG